MNTELKKNAKNDFQKDFHKLMNNAVFGKTTENVRKYRNIKLVTNNKKRCKLASKPNYHTTKWFSKRFLATEMKKVKVKMNKPIYLGFSILEVSKRLIYEFWYGYMNPEYGEKGRLCYTDVDSFIIHIKTEDFYEDVAPDVDKWFDTSGYIVDRPLPMSKNKKVLRKFKDELEGRIMTEIVGLRSKAYSFLIDDFEEKKKKKRTKKCVVKTRLRHQNYNDYLLNKEMILKSQQTFK